MGKQLTLADRQTIEKLLGQGYSFKRIGASLGKASTTVSREVRNHYIVKRQGAYGQRFNECANRFGCQQTHLCGMPECRESKCRNCRYGLCAKHCERYQRDVCARLSESPYVCNDCDDRRKCTLEKHIYDARAAQRESDEVRRESREGTHLTELELAHIRGIVAPGLKNGQSLHHIWAANKDTLMVSVRTLYNMVDGGPLADCTLDMRQKAARRPVRHKPAPRIYKVDPECKQGRHYEDYLKYCEEHPGMMHVEMDTVEGEKGAPVLLTLHFVEPQFMLAFLRPRNDARSVRNVFDDLSERLGAETFTRLLSVILTDNGSEFSDPEALEFDSEGNRRCRIFYCHPHASFEKGAAEANHRLIRYVLPKRKSSFRSLKQNQIDLMMSHVNSYLREGRDDVCAFDLFAMTHDPDGSVVQALGLEKIDPNDIVLTPALLKMV